MLAYHNSLQAAVTTNDEAIHAMFGPNQSSAMQRFFQAWSETNAYDGLGSVWCHLAKDWTTEGTEAMSGLRNRIVEVVQLHAREGARVLVPGCGQARLAWELARQADGMEVVGLDGSEAQLGVARHMLGSSVKHSLPFHPFLDEANNACSVESRLAMLRAPDVAPGSMPVPLRLMHGEFSGEWVASRQRAGEPDFQCVVSSFFLDCLPDTVAGMEAISDALAPGGLWLCAGPLAYHPWPSLSPTLEQLIGLAQELGLEMVIEPEMIPAPYVRPPNCLRHNSDWTAALWACRKPM